MIATKIILFYIIEAFLTVALSRIYIKYLYMNDLEDKIKLSILVFQILLIILFLIGSLPSINNIVTSLLINVVWDCIIVAAFWSIHSSKKDLTTRLLIVILCLFILIRLLFFIMEFR